MRNTCYNKYRNLPVQAKASFWFLVCSFLQKGISILTTPVFTRLLSTGEYGQYNVFSSWMGIITIFVTLNLYAGVYTQGLVKFDKERKVFSSSLQGLTTIMVMGWTAVYLVFREFWNTLFSLSTVQMLAMLVMIWSSTAFSFWAASQRVQYRYKALVIITLIVSFAKPVISIVFILLATDKVTARILALVLTELIGYSGFYIIQMKSGKKFISKKFWKYAVLYNLPLVPHYLSQTVLNSADRIMIKNMVGSVEAGIYSLAYSVSMIMSLFNSALMQTISPWIYQKIRNRKIKAIASVAYLSLGIIAVVNLILIVLAPEVIAVFAPYEYHEAIWVIPPVAMSVYFMYSYDLFAKFAFYYEKTNFIMMASVCGAVFNVVLNYLFIKQFGYMAAGYTTLACYIIYAVGHYFFMNKVCNQFCDGEHPYNSKIIIGMTSVFCILGFVFSITYKFVLLRYAIVFVILLIIFLRRDDVKRICMELQAFKSK